MPSARFAAICTSCCSFLRNSEMAKVMSGSSSTTRILAMDALPVVVVVGTRARPARVQHPVHLARPRSPLRFAWGWIRTATWGPGGCRGLRGGYRKRALGSWWGRVLSA